MIRRLAFTVMLGSAMLAGTLPGGPVRAQQRSSTRPNIILINLDDADSQLISPESLARYFPRLNRFATDGLRFSNCHVTTPLCGPSRACLLRGQYAHRTGIRVNDPFSSRSNGFDGGMRRYFAAGHGNDDLGTWMQAADYHTMMVGKFLHGDVINVVPAGWDDFRSSRGGEYFGTVRFGNSAVPAGRLARDREDACRTVVEAEQIAELIEAHRRVQSDQPFFLYYNPIAPHNEAASSPHGMVEPQYSALWPELALPDDRNFNEADFADKSTAIRDIRPLDERNIEYARKRHRDRHLAMKTVDDLFGGLTELLQREGLAENTWIFLTSDNGFCNGHHRLFGKSDPFHRSTSVPLYVLGPDVPAGVEARHLLAHIDLTPTIVELAGGSAPELVDGHSFLPLIRDPQSADERRWRETVLIENWESRIVQREEVNFASLALRFFDSIYVEWANGSPEFYDLADDPFQLENLWDTLSSERQQELAQQLREARGTNATPPLTTLSIPFRFGEFIPRDAALTGMVEGSAGITGVALSIQRLSDWRYWNGANWQLTATQVAAQVVRPGQLLTAWRYDALPDAAADEMLAVSAEAVDESGRRTVDHPWAVFQVDRSPPTSSIVTPATNARVESLLVEGTVSDERLVTDIRLVIRNRASGQYWSGARWVENWTWLDLPVRRRTQTWSYANSQMRGPLQISSRAVDDSGNVQTVPTTIQIEVVELPLSREGG